MESMRFMSEKQYKYFKNKEQARDKAITIQQEIAESSLSYEELFFIQQELYKLGKRYGLLKEFKEKAII